MKRITSDNAFEMNMYQLALNQVYIGKDGWTWYRNAPGDELSVCDLIRSAAETLGIDLPMLSDDELSDLLADWLQYGAEEREGVLAILYRALWAMSVVRARLAAYEDTGLGPEDIDALQKRGQGLAELLVSISCGCTVTYSRLEELARAEKDGRLSVLPFKVGDTVYRVATASKYVNNQKNTPYIEKIQIKHENAHKYISEIGKTVFLTRDAAGAELERRIGGNDEKTD